MLRNLALILLVPVLLTFAWLAAGERNTRADFVVACDALRTIDPHRVSWLDEIQIAVAMFEGLTRLNPLTYLPEPAVAERWDVSEDGRTYTFHLRPDARWSNGDPVTAEQFRDGWLRVLDPGVKSQYASLLFVIDGAREHFAREASTRADLEGSEAGEVGIEALDDRTLRVRLTAPCSYFLDLTSFPTMAPIHPAMNVSPESSDQAGANHLWTRPERFVCNGAFVLDRWDFKRRVLLRRNPHYWDADGVDLEAIELFITSDPNTALIAYESGRADMVRGLRPEVARVLAAQVQSGRRDDFVVGDRFATYFFRVNCSRPPLNDADLRKALALAIDKRAICDSVMGLGETPADTYVPRGSLDRMPRPGPNGKTIYYEPPAGLGAGLDEAARVDLAREHLRRSGFDDGRPLELAYSPEPAYQRRIAEAVKAMWESRLGIRVDLRVQERTVLSQRIRALDYDIARSDWYGDYMDPATFLGMYTTGNGQNRTGWSHAEYDRLIAAAATEADNARRFELFRDAERILCEQELPILPVFFKRGNYLLRSGFAGVADNLRDVLPIHRVTK